MGASGTLATALGGSLPATHFTMPACMPDRTVEFRSDIAMVHHSWTMVGLGRQQLWTWTTGCPGLGQVLVDWTWVSMCVLVHVCPACGKIHQILLLLRRALFASPRARLRVSFSHSPLHCRWNKRVASRLGWVIAPWVVLPCFVLTLRVEQTRSAPRRGTKTRQVANENAPALAAKIAHSPFITGTSGAPSVRRTLILKPNSAQKNTLWCHNQTRRCANATGSRAARLLM